MGCFRECQAPREQAGEESSGRSYASKTVIKMTPHGPRKLTLFDSESS